MGLVWRRGEHPRDESHAARVPADSPAAPYPTDDEARATLERLVEDVQQLRLEISSDLTVAAAAVELDAPEFATDLVERDRRQLQAMNMRAADRLAALETLRLGQPGRLSVTPGGSRRPPTHTRRGARPGDRPARSRDLRLRVVAVPVALAVSVAALMMSGTLSGVRSQHPIASSPVAASWQQFAHAATADTNATSVIAAASQLHHSLSSLIATAGSNPAHAQQVLRMLELEHKLLVDNQPEGAAVVLHDVAALAQELRAMVPSVVVPVTLIHPKLPVRPHPRHSIVVALPTSQPQPSGQPQRPETGTSTRPAHHQHPSTKPTPEHTTAPTTAPSTSSQPTTGPTPPSWQPFPTHSSLFG